MNAEGALFLIAGVIVGVPLLLLIIYLVNRISGRRVIPWWLTLLLLMGTPFAMSLFLDSVGSVHVLKVIDKRESIQYRNDFHRSGSWSRVFRIHVEQPPYLAQNESLAPDMVVGADAKTFDELEIGRPAEVCVFEAGRFRFGRLAKRSTFSIVTGWFSSPEPRGPWREATGKVMQINDYTEYLTRTPASRSPMRWPYRIVRFSFTPPGREAPVEALDTIETASLPGLTDDASVPIVWPEDAPREARLAGARPGRPWLNWFYDAGEWILLFAALLFVIAISRYFRRRRQLMQ